jgi:1-deoxy-D-xylulose 5-phosphate reductoisomerase
MADRTLIDGVPISLGGNQYTVPALSLGQVKRLMPDIDSVTANGTPQDQVVSSAIKITTAALSRNYPEITAEQVEEMLDLSNFKTVLDAVMGISGLVPSGEATGATGR